MATRPLYVGIDLGTTNSTAAVFDGEKLILVRNAQGGSLTPSVVRLDARGGLTVGARARRFLESDPDNTRSEFKRLMGTGQAIEFPAAKTTRRPEELAAEVLKSLRADVVETMGLTPARAVISVPALFELPQSSATSEAARLAGFEKVELIQEPVASALAAGWSADSATGSWLVYDLGGGTFDASLLETRDGLLRVVGHDGDNFLGGRDFDWAVVNWVLGELARTGGPKVSRSDPQHAAALRKLKLAVEEAKIELTRTAEAPVTLPGLFDGADVDVVLERARVEALCAPLIERSLEVCQRLLASHGLRPDQLSKIVLVGGPTLMPALRERVRAVLGVPFGEGLDPMTLVAQGAAIYAATAGLDARAPEAPRAGGRRVWLQHPAMSSDLTPHLVGRFTEEAGALPAGVRALRADGLWQSPEAPLDAEGAFVLTVELLARRPNVFTLEARAKDGTVIAVEPPGFTIVQGMTISDPPLSRTIGVALANDYVHVYFERGAPLPARRTFRHHTVETVSKGSSGGGGNLLKIPIVQGELEKAHLCRLVGALEIGGAGVTATLPAGSPLELTIELDRGGHLSARALVVATGQVFEQVAHLLVPDASPEALEASLQALRGRLVELRTDAFRRGAAKGLAKLDTVEAALADVERDVGAARGGDADAAQKARRTLIELDATIEEVDADKRWPELDDEARHRLAQASQWVAELGTPTEQKLLEEAAQAVARARTAKNAVDLQRQLRVVRNLSNAAFNRHPKAAEWSFDEAASRADEATDLPRAQKLVREGRQAIERGDTQGLRAIVSQLWQLLPADAQDRRLGHDSGVR